MPRVTMLGQGQSWAISQQAMWGWGRFCGDAQPQTVGVAQLAKGRSYLAQMVAKDATVSANIQPQLMQAGVRCGKGREEKW